MSYLKVSDGFRLCRGSSLMRSAGSAGHHWRAGAQRERRGAGGNGGGYEFRVMWVQSGVRVTLGVMRVMAGVMWPGVLAGMMGPGVLAGMVRRPGVWSSGSVHAEGMDSGTAGVTHDHLKTNPDSQENQPIARRTAYLSWKVLFQMLLHHGFFFQLCDSGGDGIWGRTILPAVLGGGSDGTPAAPVSVLSLLLFRQAVLLTSSVLVGGARVLPGVVFFPLLKKFVGTNVNISGNATISVSIFDRLLLLLVRTLTIFIPTKAFSRSPTLLLASVPP